MVSRQRFSADVHQEVRSQIIRGELAPGQRISDSELAQRLGVSRTPVREALLRLEREGFISSRKHLGFSVKGLCESEILEVYPLVRLLECTALRSVPLPCLAKLDRLRELGAALEQSNSDPFHRIELDSSWHKLLVEDNGNQHLLRILTELKSILFRYEYAFMQNDALVSKSAAEHAAITASLGERDQPEAIRLLEAHWNRCTAATLTDFQARGARS